jgi:sugar O-acyltransferase (sialic acid O-acetyltransferase NeuD family)
MKKQIILVGAYHEMIEVCEEAGFEVVGIIDNTKTGEYFGIPIIGADCNAKEIRNKYPSIPVVLSPYMPKTRKRIYEMYSSLGYSFETVISPQATISRFATIGEGTVVLNGVNVAANTCIGRFVKLNTMCNIMHDNTIGDFVTISPNALSLGYVTIENEAFLGGNCTILPYMTVGAAATIGAAAVVTKDVAAGQVVKGNPAK